MSNEKIKVILDGNMFDFFMNNGIRPTVEADGKNLSIEFGITPSIQREVEDGFQKNPRLAEFFRELMPSLKIFSPKVFGFGVNNFNFNNAGFSNGRQEEITRHAVDHPSHRADLLHMGISAALEGYLVTQERAMAVKVAREMPYLRLISFYRGKEEIITAENWLEYLIIKINDFKSTPKERGGE